MNRESETTGKLFPNFYVIVCLCFQQRESALFTVANDIEATYDAYEKDIAIVTFFFEQKPAIFEYIRFVVANI